MIDVCFVLWSRGVERRARGWMGLFLAIYVTITHGCQSVKMVDDGPDMVERVSAAATDKGLPRQISSLLTIDLRSVYDIQTMARTSLLFD